MTNKTWWDLKEKSVEKYEKGVKTFSGNMFRQCRQQHEKEMQDEYVRGHIDGSNQTFNGMVSLADVEKAIDEWADKHMLHRFINEDFEELKQSIRNLNSPQNSTRALADSRKGKVKQ